MRYEFQVNLKKIQLKSKPVVKDSKPKMPNLRKHLVLAYQMDRFMKDRNIKYVDELQKYIPLTQSRMCQILRLLLLAPRIQEDILIDKDSCLHNIKEKYIRPIPREIDWGKQILKWDRCKSRLHTVQ